VLQNGKHVDPEAISLFHKQPIHAIYDPDIKKDKSKGKTVIYKSYPKDSLPKTRDPRPHYMKLQPQPKRHKKMPYKSLPIPRLVYDKNSVGPQPPSEIIVSGLGNIWNATYLRNQILTFGEILEYDNVLDPSTGIPLGIIRVKFGGSVDRSHRSAKKCIQELNNSHFEGKTIHAIIKKDDKTLEDVRTKEINKRIGRQKAVEIKPALPPAAPKAHINAIARREAMMERKLGIAQEPPVSQKKAVPERKSEPFKIPKEIVKYLKSRPFLFIDSKTTQNKITKEDIKKHLRSYDWTRVLEEPAGIFIVFNTQNESKRCFHAENGRWVRAVKLEITLQLPENCIAEEVLTVEYADPLDEATALLTTEFENALQKDIRTKVIAPAVLEFLSIDNFPDLKEKIQPPPPPLPLHNAPILKEDSFNSMKPKTEDVAEDVFSLHRTFPKLPSFKKKPDAIKNLTKKKRAQKLEILPLSYKLNFDDEDDDYSRDSPLDTPPGETTPDFVKGPPRKKAKRAKDPVLFSSSEEDEDEDDTQAKESIPTTPEVPQVDKMELDQKEVDNDIDMDETEVEDEPETQDIEEDFSGVDKLYRPTITDTPITVYEDPEGQTLDFEGIKSILKDDEDFKFMKVVLDTISDKPIKGSLEYWAWKQKNIRSMNKTLTAEKFISNVENSTGSQRSQGYIKIPDEIKVEYLPHRKKVHDPLATIQVENDDGESSKVQSSRVNRANNRRFAYEVSNFNTENEILKLNQLNKRKKPVSFARSAIHNWGLYALEPIAEKEMIIEYVGERIRQQVADVRERAYLKSGIGSSYLFRIDADTVIDATKKGGIARFINHCCVPSCTAKIIKVDGQKRIVIYALRDIAANEELTYDYKFERDENDNERVRCLCGAPGCKGYLN
jgi:histone-lysine N-methyltransferase SETD1